MSQLRSHYIFILFIGTLFLIIPSPLHAQGLQSTADLYGPKLEKNLIENIIPFWLNNTLDKKNGGYILSADTQGEPLKDRTKMIVTQARQVWLFSHLYRSDYSKPEYLEAATLGYRFLREKMWDKKHGGFYWLVDESGDQALVREKILYGQAFALYAVSEYFMATQKPEALEWAREIY